jgi:hypothetical protein
VRRSTTIKENRMPDPITNADVLKLVDLLAEEVLLLMQGQCGPHEQVKAAQARLKQLRNRINPPLQADQGGSV